MAIANNNNNQCLMFVALMIILNVIFMSPYSIFKLYFYCNGLPFKNPTIYHHHDNNYSINNLSSLYGIKLKNQKILNDIKEAFKMFPNNGHLKKMIPKMFNIYNPNPIYAFLLPFSNNKSAIIDVDDNSSHSINSTIILERNDFSTPIYPNITVTDIILDWLLSSLYRRNKNSNSNKNKNDENFEYDKSPNRNIQHQIYRYIEENTILENIKTEKNFIDYVKELNAKEMMILSSSTENPFPLQYPSTTNRIETIKQNEWEILGLKGWEGSVIDPKKFNEDISFSAPTESNRWTRQNKNDLFNLNKLFSTIQMNSSNENYENLNNKTEWDLPGKMSLSNKDDDDDDDDDENVKSKFMLKLNDTLLKMFNFDSNNDNNDDGSKLKKLKWPITSSRKNHRDSDIFIGRANDPFGHSTKWQTKNQTKQNNNNNNNDNNDNNNSNDDDRHKRAIIELYSMIKCSTGCDPLIYKGYGCYCGFSGAGHPIDGIDRCCRLHDICYDKSVCPSFLEYFVPYLWKCYRGKPLCAIEHGEWGNGINSCASRLCQCDLKLAKCLQKFQCPKKRLVCRTSKIRMLQNFLTIF